MFEPTSGPSHHEAKFMPYAFRPFWQPNSQGSPPYADITLLSQKLNMAEKKVFEYTQLSESQVIPSNMNH
jgi:hypothetical protein